MHQGFGGPPWNRGRGPGGPGGHGPNWPGSGPGGHGPNWPGSGGGRRGGWFMQPPMWGFLQPCLLLLLKEGPKHGYSLMEELGKRKLLGQDVDVGNLYRTLRRMEGEGLVESAWSEQSTGPNKRIYQITSNGDESLMFWATALEQRTSMIYNFLTEFHRIVTDTGQPRPDFSSDSIREPFLGEDNPI